MLVNTSLLLVGTVVRRRSQILLVRQSLGHPLEGQWTIPWGSVERGESAASAALRETHEEGGVTAEITGLVGVQELPPPQDGCIAIVYACKHVSGDPEPRDREVDAARYFDCSAFDSLDEPIEPWTNWLIRRAFDGDIGSIISRPDNPLQVHGAFV